ncbi:MULTISPECIES: LamG domain-containing protein [Methylobacterium]|uniref:N,N-dimethylformamidase beta subunit n=6 Tax=Pseudomonadota TaxID=1224 RepID=A0ABQ4T486_9HYPH|nr:MULTISPECIES: LamG domain-containing protein [Methylobacterium]PIU08406.1 MAG: N,N-dimethylformamidase [Methylobacterium sp. CG09_land_8_20_14_0_10_71_15]PIU11695.1 MAG: N,N-dimethylformamidase [Methylobacterium sp. CG08_land_8_20_14_0_20_71_15]GBU18630.1 large subunit of N,N-dimethylformamidase [Methylobacterium sp.]GJE08721.1 N,N-dimethylformamidase beta subunit [Methylobacterium jeotgali]
MSQVKLFGYTDRISAKPGERIDVHVNADGTDTAEAQLVRLVHGDAHPSGPGYIEEEVACEANGPWKVWKQYTQVGSFLRVADPHQRLAPDGSFTVFTYLWSTLPMVGLRQSLVGRWDIRSNKGFGFGINRKGFLEFWVGDGSDVDYVAAEAPLIARIWYFVAVSYDARTGRAEIFQEPVVNRYNSLLGKVVPMDYRSHVAETLRFRPRHDPQTPFLIAGAQDWHEARGHFVGQCFCGKLDRPGLYGRALSREEMAALQAGQRPADGLLAFWDTTAGYTERGIGDTVIDTGPHGLDAVGYNRPVRAQTGYNWNGRNDCFRLAPQEYGGVEFHVDTMIDSNWSVTRTLTLPDGLKSGAYAIRLRAGPGRGLAEEYVVFFVRAKVPKAPVAFLVPTGSYLAYANEHLSFDAQIIQPMTGQPPIVDEIDIEMYKNPDFGLSTYDSYEDGAGVCFSSFRRPILNMRPKYRMSSMGTTWQFPADLSVIAWLDQSGFDYEVLTEQDVHQEGLAALKPYRCVLSGTHPEYISERVLDATEDFIAEGGRFIYMGGNGYYWNVAYRDDEPWIMEVRKLDSGMRAWAARPGEHYLQTTGDKSGLWRNRGRPPQKTLGVGFIGEGFESGKPFRRMPDSYHRTVSWITEGIEGEIIGDFGLAQGGAAGLELDRYDLKLGTPPHAKIIASSGGHTDNYVLSVEEVLYAYPGMTGTQDYRIRADMVFFTAPNGGAVFSASSIAFGQALPVDGFKNSVAKLLTNVVGAFAKNGPVPGEAWISDEKQWR